MSSLPSDIWKDVLAPASRWDLDHVGLASRGLQKFAAKLHQRRAFISVLIGSSSRPMFRASPDEDCFIVFTWQKGVKCLGRLTVTDCGNTREAVQHATYKTLDCAHIESVVMQASFGYHLWRFYEPSPAECKELFDWLGIVPVDHLYLKQSEFTAERMEELKSRTRKGIKSICDYAPLA